MESLPVDHLVTVNPIALRKAKIRKAKIVYNFGLSECKRVKIVKTRISKKITLIVLKMKQFGL